MSLDVEHQRRVKVSILMRAMFWIASRITHHARAPDPVIQAAMRVPVHPCPDLVGEDQLA
jgi:hypothetical protein